MGMIVKLRPKKPGSRRTPHPEPEPERSYTGPLPVILIALVGIVIIGVVGLHQGREIPYPYGPDRVVAERLEAHLADIEQENHQAALRGVLWTVRLVQPDDHFGAVFSDYLLMLHEHQQRARDETVRRCLTDLIRNALDRAAPRLETLFPADAYGAWDFRTILRILWAYGGPRKVYEAYHEDVLAKQPPIDYARTFAEALADRDYDALCDHLVDAAFLHYLRAAPQARDMELPEDRLDEYVEALGALEFVHSATSDPRAYSDQNYFATHVILALSDYGIRPLTDSRLTRRTLRYLQEEFEPVWRRVPDVDLLAEFVQSLEIGGLGDQALVRQARHRLVERQHADGSWGSAEDLGGNPYQALHPTWTVSTALMQGAAFAGTPGADAASPR